MHRASSPRIEQTPARMRVATAWPHAIFSRSSWRADASAASSKGPGSGAWAAAATALRPRSWRTSTLHVLDPRQERRPDLRPAPFRPPPGGLAIPFVEVDVRVPVVVRQVLDVEAVLRPLGDRPLAQLAGLTGLVGRQPGEDARVGAQGRFHVAVAPLAGLLVQGLEAARQLGELPLVDAAQSPKTWDVSSSQPTPVHSSRKSWAARSRSLTAAGKRPAK